jgi:hypothetical protein
MANMQFNAAPSFVPPGMQIDPRMYQPNASTHYFASNDYHRGNGDGGNGRGRGRGNSRWRNRHSSGIKSNTSTGYFQGPLPSDPVYRPQAPSGELAWTPAFTGPVSMNTVPFSTPEAPFGITAGSDGFSSRTPPMAMARVGSFGEVRMSGSQSGCYVTSPSVHQPTPTLHAPTPRRHAKIVDSSHHLAVEEAIPTKPMSATPTSSAILLTLGVGEENESGGTRAASVNIIDTAATDTFDTNKQDLGNTNDKPDAQKPLEDYSTLQHLAALPATVRTAMLSPLSTHRSTHLTAQKAITAQRNDIYEALQSYILHEQQHEKCAREFQDLVGTNLELAAKQVSGSSKDKYFMTAAHQMRKASEHSKMAYEYAVEVGRCKDRLERLNRKAVKAAEAWYEGMHREIMRVLGDGVVSVEEDDRRGEKEMRESKEKMDGDLESDKREKKTEAHEPEEGLVVREKGKTKTEDSDTKFDGRTESVPDIHVKPADQTNKVADQSAPQKMATELLQTTKEVSAKDEKPSDIAPPTTTTTLPANPASNPKKQHNKRKGSGKKKRNLTPQTSSSPSPNENSNAKDSVKEPTINSHTPSTAPKNERKGHSQGQGQGKGRGGAKT